MKKKKTSTPSEEYVAEEITEECVECRDEPSETIPDDLAKNFQLLRAYLTSFASMSDDEMLAVAQTVANDLFNQLGSARRGLNEIVDVPEGEFHFTFNTHRETPWELTYGAKICGKPKK